VLRWNIASWRQVPCNPNQASQKLTPQKFQAPIPCGLLSDGKTKRLDIYKETSGSPKYFMEKDGACDLAL
jgi:hypothetical protein